MATLTLTNQKAASDAIKPRLADLKTALLARKEVFDRLPDAKKLAWIKSDRDPVMSTAWAIHQWLKDYFQEVENGA